MSFLIWNFWFDFLSYFIRRGNLSMLKYYSVIKKIYFKKLSLNKISDIFFNSETTILVIQIQVPMFLTHALCQPVTS